LSYWDICGGDILASRGIFVMPVGTCITLEAPWGSIHPADANRTNCILHEKNQPNLAKRTAALVKHKPNLLI